MLSSPASFDELWMSGTGRACPGLEKRGIEPFGRAQAGSAPFDQLMALRKLEGQRLNSWNVLNSLPDPPVISARVTARLVDAFVDIEKNVGYGLTPSRRPEFDNSPAYLLSDWVEKFELISQSFSFSTTVAWKK
jgi:hypothetical protein